jgi:general secretion pathway protein H
LQHRRAGFTLLELMIVLTVSVLALSVVAIRIGSGDRSTQLIVVARDLASALRYAHGQALLRHQSVAVAINLDDNSYRISDRERIYPIADAIEISLVVAEEEFAQGAGSIRFFADGSSTGGRVSLHLGKQLRRVDVNWITGAVSISDEPA